MVGAQRPTKIADSRLPAAYSASEIKIEMSVPPTYTPLPPFMCALPPERVGLLGVSTRRPIVLIGRALVAYAKAELFGTPSSGSPTIENAANDEVRRIHLLSTPVKSGKNDGLDAAMFT
jgi:hypothetical protein